MEGEESDTLGDLNELDDVNNQQLLKIFYVNINGLNNHKIKYSDMMKDIDNSDLIYALRKHTY